VIACPVVETQERTAQRSGRTCKPRIIYGLPSITSVGFAKP
jgi:hypothetical protein